MPTLADWNQVYDDLDWDDLLEPHPLNEGRVFWGLGLPPLDGGPQLYDITQNTRGGTLTNGPTWTATNYGPGISFDGVNDYIQLSSSPFASTNFTLSWRGNLGAPSGYAGVIAAGSGSFVHGIAQNPNSGIFLIQTADTNNQTVSVTGANQQGDHFWTLLFTATTITIYRDGVLAGSTSFAATSFPWTAGTRIGYSDLGTYLGTINELTVHNRLLGISEVQELPSLSQRGYPGVLRRRKRTSVFVLGSTGGTSFTLNADPGSFALAGSPVQFAQAINAAPGSIAMAGSPVAFAGGINAAPGAFALAGQPATFAGGLSASPGGFTLAGNPVQFASGLSASPGAFTLTGQPVAFGVGLAATPGSYSLAGSPVTFTLAMGADAGAFAWTGYPADLVWAGAVIVDGRIILKNRFALDSGRVHSFTLDSREHTFILAGRIHPFTMGQS